MKRILAAVVLLLSHLVATSHAAVGDTLEQFVTQYGPARKDTAEARVPGHEQFLFEKDGLVIECVIGDDQKCIMEAFHRRGPKISDQDIAAILKSEAPNHSWAFNKQTSQWLRGDNKLRAYRVPGHDDFVFVELVPGKTNDTHGATSGNKGDGTTFSALPPAMSWEGAIVHPTHVLAANNARVVFATTENHPISVPVAALPDNVAKRFEAEIAATQKKDQEAAMSERLNQSGAAAIFGRVLRKTPDGVLLVCGSPGGETQFAMADGGEPVPMGKVALAGVPGTQVLLRNLPNEAALVDNDSVSVIGYVAGTWQYQVGQGIMRTVRVYSATPLRNK